VVPRETRKEKKGERSFFFFVFSILPLKETASHVGEGEKKKKKKGRKEVGGELRRFRLSVALKEEPYLTGERGKGREKGGTSPAIDCVPPFAIKNRSSGREKGKKRDSS